MANSVATLALFSWPIVVLVLFQKFDRPLAVMLGLLGGFLLLPVEGGIDFPLLPSFEKYSIPSLAVLAFVYMMRPKSSDPASLPGLFPAGGLPKLLIAGVVVGSFLTVLTNQDPLSYGPRYIRGLRVYDAFSFVMQTGIILLPLLLARKLLGHPDQQRRFLIVICVAALGYSLLALYEVRMSPQLNRMIYGFFPHSWLQHIRGGGYRPLVFARACSGGVLYGHHFGRHGPDADAQRKPAQQIFADGALAFYDAGSVEFAGCSDLGDHFYACCVFPRHAGPTSCRGCCRGLGDFLSHQSGRRYYSNRLASDHGHQF